MHEMHENISVLRFRIQKNVVIYLWRAVITLLCVHRCGLWQITSLSSPILTRWRCPLYSVWCRCYLVSSSVSSTMCKLDTLCVCVCVCLCVCVMHLVSLRVCCGIVVLLCVLCFHSVCRVFWVTIWSNGKMIITPSCTVVPSCTASSPHVWRSATQSSGWYW